MGCTFCTLCITLAAKIIRCITYLPKNKAKGLTARAVCDLIQETDDAESKPKTSSQRVGGAEIPAAIRIGMDGPQRA